MPMTFATETEAAVPLHLLEAAGLEAWLADQPARVATWAKAAGFSAKLGQALVIPGEDGAPAAALANSARMASDASKLTTSRH